MANALHRRPRGFTLLEMVIALTVLAVVTALATGAIIAFDHDEATRKKIVDVQSTARQALSWMEMDLRHASLSAGSGVIWTWSNGTRVPRPAVQIFAGVQGPGSLSLNPKPNTDALLVVGAVPSSVARAATSGDVTSGAAVSVTTTAGFTSSETVVMGDYGDASWGLVASIVSGEPGQLTLSADVPLPGQQVPLLPRGSVVRAARARLYYVDTSDQLVRLQLTVPRAPVVADEVLAREVLAQGFENMKIDCQLDGGVGALQTCPGPESTDATVVSESAAALGDFGSGQGPLFTRDNIGSLRSVIVNVVVRSRTPRQGGLGDPATPLCNASDPPVVPCAAVALGDTTQQWIRRTYQLPAAVRNTSLGAL